MARRTALSSLGPAVSLSPLDRALLECAVSWPGSTINELHTAGELLGSLANCYVRANELRRRGHILPLRPGYFGRTKNAQSIMKIAALKPVERHMLEALETGPQTYDEIAESVGYAVTTIRQYCVGLRARRLITPCGGLWATAKGAASL